MVIVRQGVLRSGSARLYQVSAEKGSWMQSNATDKEWHRFPGLPLGILALHVVECRRQDMQSVTKGLGASTG